MKKIILMFLLLLIPFGSFGGMSKVLILKFRSSDYCGVNDFEVNLAEKMSRFLAGIDYLKRFQVLAELSIGDEELSLSDLAKIGSVSGADSIVWGEINCTNEGVAPSVSVVVFNTLSSNIVMSNTFSLASSNVYDSIVESVVSAVIGFDVSFGTLVVKLPESLNDSYEVYLNSIKIGEVFPNSEFRKKVLAGVEYSIALRNTRTGVVAFKSSVEIPPDKSRVVFYKPKAKLVVEFSDEEDLPLEEIYDKNKRFRVFVDGEYIGEVPVKVELTAFDMHRVEVRFGDSIVYSRGLSIPELSVKKIVFSRDFFTAEEGYKVWQYGGFDSVVRGGDEFNAIVGNLLGGSIRFFRSFSRFGGIILGFGVFGGTISAENVTGKWSLLMLDAGVRGTFDILDRLKVFLDIGGRQILSKEVYVSGVSGENFSTGGGGFAGLGAEFEVLDGLSVAVESEYGYVLNNGILIDGLHIKAMMGIGLFK